MNKETKSTIKQVLYGVSPLLMLLIVGLSTEAFLPYLIFPAAVGYSAGVAISYEVKKVFNWKSGLLWGAISLAAGVLAYIAI